MSPPLANTIVLSRPDDWPQWYSHVLRYATTAGCEHMIDLDGPDFIPLEKPPRYGAFQAVIKQRDGETEGPRAPQVQPPSTFDIQMAHAIKTAWQEEVAEIRDIEGYITQTLSPAAMDVWGDRQLKNVQQRIRKLASIYGLSDEQAVRTAKAQLDAVTRQPTKGTAVEKLDQYLIALRKYEHLASIKESDRVRSLSLLTFIKAHCSEQWADLWYSLSLANKDIDFDKLVQSFKAQDTDMGTFEKKDKPTNNPASFVASEERRRYNSDEAPDILRSTDCPCAQPPRRHSLAACWILWPSVAPADHRTTNDQRKRLTDFLSNNPEHKKAVDKWKRQGGTTFKEESGSSGPSGPSETTRAQKDTPRTYTVRFKTPEKEASSNWATHEPWVPQGVTPELTFADDG